MGTTTMIMTSLLHAHTHTHVVWKNINNKNGKIVCKMDRNRIIHKSFVCVKRLVGICVKHKHQYNIKFFLRGNPRCYPQKGTLSNNVNIKMQIGAPTTIRTLFVFFLLHVKHQKLLFGAKKQPPCVRGGEQEK